MYLGTGLEPRNLFGDGPPKDSDNNGGQLVACSLTLIIVTIIVVVVRVYCRAHLMRTMGADDYSHLGVLAFGLGRHAWTLPTKWKYGSRKSGYLGQICYFVSLGFTKSSLLLFLIRLTESLSMSRVCWGVLLFCLLHSTAATVTSILQCVPPSYAWESIINPKKAKGYCLDPGTLQYTLPAVNILTDFIIWLLPVKLIWNMRLPPRQKASLFALFAISSLGVIAAILRLFSIRKFVGSTDRSWDGLDISIWSIVEANICIICGSAPALKPFFSKFLPGLLGVSSFKSYSNPDSLPKPTARARTRPPGAYSLGTLNAVTNHEESSSTEHLDFGPSTKIEGRTANGSASGSQENLEPHGNSVEDGAVKVTTDVQVHVEERV